MRASFFGLHVTTAGLHSARNATYVTAHNVSNVNTLGFSRQEAVIRASTPLNTFSRAGMLGTGSEMQGVQQIRDFHLDNRFRAESSILGHHHAVTIGLTISESIFAVFDAANQSNYFNDFFDSLQMLSTNPTEPSMRQNVVQTTDNLTRLISSQAEALRRQQLDINAEIGSTVRQINILGEQLQRVNSQIDFAEINGGRANDLRDRRALILDELSELVNIQVTEENIDGRERLAVHIDGQLFVNHDQVINLVIQRREYPLNSHDEHGLYTIIMTHGGVEVPFNYLNSRTLSGLLGGLIEVRDGNSMIQTEGDHAGRSYSPVAFRGVPFYKMRLNNMINDFANAVNFGTNHLGVPIEGLEGGHIAARDFQGNVTGIPFFVPLDVNGEAIRITDEDSPHYGEIDFSAIDIFNISLNPEIVQNPALIATHTGVSSEGESANSFLISLASLQNNREVFPEGSISDVITTIMAELAGDLNRAVTFHDTQEAVVMVIHNQRLSVKGVSLNEETNKLLLFQAQFVALARMVTVMDSIYDTMINRMGLT